MIKSFFSKALAVACLVVLINTTPAVAASWYVNSSVATSGAGTTWSAAWKDFPDIVWGSISPGDTIYIAAGTYSSLGIYGDGTAGNPITLKRATVAEHGTNTGWSSGLDGQVTIDGGSTEGGAIAFGDGGDWVGHNYITIDGVTKYGIKVINAYYGVRAVLDPGNNNLTFRYIEFGPFDEDGIQGKGDNLLIEYCYIHDNDSQVTHGDGIQWFEGDSVIVRYNIIKNSGQTTMLGYTGWNAIVNDFEFYYNVVYNRGGTHYNGITIDTTSPAVGRYMRVYNNTFDLEATDNSGYNNLFNHGAGTRGTLDFKNNAIIYSNAASVSSSVNHTYSYNAYDNSGTFSVYNIPSSETGRVVASDLGFTNVTTALNSPSNYRLLENSPLINAGTNVSLTQDFDGNPISGNPDIGAFEYSSDVTPPTVSLTAPADGATVSGVIQVSATASDDVGVVGVQFKLDGVNLGAEDTAAAYSTSWDTTTAGNGSHTLSAVARDDANNSTTSATRTVTVNNIGTEYSLWPSSATPAVDSDVEATPVELGVKFVPLVSGEIRGVRFYKSVLNTGTHTAALWNSSGGSLATATFSGETASGWQEVRFTTPVAVSQGQTYTASYHTDVGRYSSTASYFATAYTNAAANLSAPISAGVYAPGATAFPQSVWANTNYWVDVVFWETPPPDTTPPTVPQNIRAVPSP